MTRFLFEYSTKIINLKLSNNSIQIDIQIATFVCHIWGPVIIFILSNQATNMEL